MHKRKRKEEVNLCLSPALRHSPPPQSAVALWDEFEWDVIQMILWLMSVDNRMPVRGKQKQASGINGQDTNSWKKNPLYSIFCASCGREQRRAHPAGLGLHSASATKTPTGEILSLPPPTGSHVWSLPLGLKTPQKHLHQVHTLQLSHNVCLY